MLESLAPRKENSPEPRLTVDKGEKVDAEQTPEEAEAEKVRQAAAELGKKGGEATAAKKAEEKEAAEREAKAKEAAEKRKGNPRHDPTARVTEATREAKEAREAKARAEAERDAERQERQRLAAEVEQLRKGAPAPKEPAKVAAADDPEPQPDDYESHEKWVRATARWEARQEFKECQQEASKGRIEAARSENIGRSVKSYVERLSEAEKITPDFKERTLAVATALQPSFTRGDQPLMPSHIVADEIINSEHGPALLLHLADHPEVLQRFNALPRHPSTISLIQREMAKLEARVEAATADASPQPQVSRANPPVRSVTGSPITAEPDITGDMDLDTFMSRKRARGQASAR